MDLDIRPYVGVGPLRFGMTRTAVGAALRSKARALRRGSASASPTDAFEEEGVYVEYDGEDECEAIEMASPALPTLQGRSLIGVPFKELRDWLASVDATLEVDNAGLTSPLFGIGLFAPAAAKEPLEAVEAVIAFRRGYYDEPAEASTDQRSS